MRKGNQMWHPITFVAESRRVEAQELAAFALANKDKYGIVVENGIPEVNTWHVDQLVADFRAALPKRGLLDCGCLPVCGCG